MYNLIEYSDNYSKISGSLWQYFKEIPAINNVGNIADFNGANATDSLIFLKQKEQVRLLLIIMMVTLLEEYKLK